jgi:hypothetical protein
VVLKLLNDDKQRAAISQAARAWARGNFSANAMVAEISAIYRKELLNDRFSASSPVPGLDSYFHKIIRVTPRFLR